MPKNTLHSIWEVPRKKSGDILEFALQRRRNGHHSAGDFASDLHPFNEDYFCTDRVFKEKDYVYVVISSIVLAIMAISFFTGYAH